MKVERYRLLLGSNTNELHARQFRGQFAEILRHFDRLLDRNLVRRRVHHFAVGKKSGGITQPDRVPVGFNLSRCRPA